MGKRKLSDVVRGAWTANVLQVREWDQQAGKETRWSVLPVGSLFLGGEIGLTKKEANDVFWLGTDGSRFPFDEYKGWSQFKKGVRAALTVRTLEDASASLRQRRTQRAIQVGTLIAAAAAAAIPGLGIGVSAGIVAAGAKLAADASDGLSIDELATAADGIAKTAGIDLREELDDVMPGMGQAFGALAGDGGGDGSQPATSPGGLALAAAGGLVGGGRGGGIPNALQGRGGRVNNPNAGNSSTGKASASNLKAALVGIHQRYGPQVLTMVLEKAGIKPGLRTLIVGVVGQLARGAMPR